MPMSIARLPANRRALSRPCCRPRQRAALVRLAELGEEDVGFAQDAALHTPPGGTAVPAESGVIIPPVCGPTLPTRADSLIDESALTPECCPTAGAEAELECDTIAITLYASRRCLQTSTGRTAGPICRHQGRPARPQTLGARTS